MTSVGRALPKFALARHLPHSGVYGEPTGCALQYGYVFLPNYFHGDESGDRNRTALGRPYNEPNGSEIA